MGIKQRNLRNPELYRKKKRKKRNEYEFELSIHFNPPLFQISNFFFSLQSFFPIVFFDFCRKWIIQVSYNYIFLTIEGNEESERK